MFKKYLNQRGFTLIELLVVILIIVILATAGIASYSSATRNARNAKRKNDMEAVKQALILYRQENSSYPNTSFSDLLTTYLIPDGYLGSDAATSLVDPGSNTYTYVGGGNTFRVYVALEGTNKGNYSNTTCTSTTGNKNYYCALNP